MKFKAHWIITLMMICPRLSGQSIIATQTQAKWPEEVLASLSLEEKIGQMLMIPAWSDPNHNSYDHEKVKKYVSQYGVGGIIFMQGSPGRQARLTNEYQRLAKVPLLIAMDAEWGLGMRLDSSITYPRQLTIGACTDDSLTYDFGRELARQLKRIGVHVSFSPVVDINNNCKNPVISNRSFGEPKDWVAAQSLMYMSGLQDNGIMACAKHFPGHGDTEIDSHKDLPIIPHNRSRIDSLELYPYRHLIRHGLGSVMTGHLNVPAWDRQANLPATLSENLINGLLRSELCFDGLVFTDAMNMQGVSKNFKTGEMDMLAIKAGNDIVLFPSDVEKAIAEIKSAVHSGLISMESIDAHCLRILKTKYWTGAWKREKIKTTRVTEELNTPEALALRRTIIESSLTLIRNHDGIIPLTKSNAPYDLIVNVGASTDNEFVNTLNKYGSFKTLSAGKSQETNIQNEILAGIDKKTTVIFAVMGTSNKVSANFGISPETSKLINRVAQTHDVCVALFANPYALGSMSLSDKVKSIIVCYQDDAMTHVAAAEIIAGALPAVGALPVNACTEFPMTMRMVTNGGDKLRWPLSAEAYNSALRCSNGTIKLQGPAGAYEEDMMEDGKISRSLIVSNSIEKIDEIAMSGINSKAYPGCRILISKDAEVVYDKSFGYTDYDKQIKVSEQTVYDLASITKIVSSTVALMKLCDLGQVDMQKNVGDYLNLPAGSPYAKVSLKSMMSHCAGFTPWIPFYAKTIKNGQLNSNLYKSSPCEGYNTQVAASLYISDSYKDTIFNEILATPLSPEKTYKYSDLGYYFVQRIVEKQSGKTLDKFVEENFYQPMGLKSIGYKPLNRIPENLIAPTENDNTFRLQHLKGFVHDQGAAMMGGVAGHAGVFSNAKDLAIMMQMLMAGGSYGGHRYINEETIQLFNTRHFPNNRRGLGFDKPVLKGSGGSACREASGNSFGHTGFTGTMAWADPETGLVFVFLSNRVNPDADNKKLQDLDIRTLIQAEAYKVWGNRK
jgi:beta-glucosidase-like glycosyl hydrolase/CubicO group peptidase (beta-lactamase class C family)